MLEFKFLNIISTVLTLSPVREQFFFYYLLKTAKTVEISSPRASIPIKILHIFTGMCHRTGRKNV